MRILDGKRLLNDGRSIFLNCKIRVAMIRVESIMFMTETKKIVKRGFWGRLQERALIDSQEIKNSMKDVIFGQAIDDALGLGTEFMPHAEVLANYPNGLTLIIRLFKTSIGEDGGRESGRTIRI